MLDNACMKYGQRPSSMLCIEEPEVALDFDLAIMMKVKLIEMGLTDKQKKQKNKANLLNLENMKMQADRLRNR